jgi:hypothetical protein
MKPAVKGAETAQTSHGGFLVENHTTTAVIILSRIVIKQINF